MNLNFKRVAIAKTNHIGDMVISLPMATHLKNIYPNVRIIFIGNAASCDIAKMAKAVDEVYDWQKISNHPDPISQLSALKLDVFVHASPCRHMARLVKQAQISIRVGSLFRLYHWRSCNRLANISRRFGVNKRLLDLQYLRPLGLFHRLTEQDLPALYELKSQPLSKAHRALLSESKFNLVLHPGAKTAKADCWPIEKYQSLIRALDKNKFHILISGTEDERENFASLLAEEGVVDLMGRMSLAKYFNFLKYVDGLVAGSTGPLHLADAQSKPTLGLYRHNQSYIRRWQPINEKSSILSDSKGISNISVQAVQQRLMNWVI